MYPASVEYLNRQWIIPKLRKWTSCDFACIALLLPIVLGFCLSVFCFFLSIVFSVCYHWWICFLVWLLSSFFHSFLFLKLFLKFFIFNNYFLFFIIITLFFYYYFLNSFFLSSHFYSEPCGWQGLGAPVRCQACVSEVGEPSYGHWSTRELPVPRNIKCRKSPRDDLHLNAKTQLQSTTTKLQCWTPMTNN